MGEKIIEYENNMELKSWLVDVPVYINIWIRPECQKRQFEVIKKARPSILFIQSDGGRNESEIELINMNRQMIDSQIDWDCQVFRIYESMNNGMYTMLKKSLEFVWSKVDRCILLEDDVIPTVSFFTYCAELLEKYKDDQRIECICGMNHLGVSDDVNADYFFSRQGSIWGIAIWKRVYDESNNFEYGTDEYIMKLLKERTRHNPIAWKRLLAYSQGKLYEGHVAGIEFWYEFHMYSQNRIQIIPKKNMISNIGYGEDSVHADKICILPKGLRRIFDMKTYEIDFPMKHPQYVIPDIGYERKRNKIMGYNDFWVCLWRKIEYVWVITKNGEFLKWLRNKNKINIEK